MVHSDQQVAHRSTRMGGGMDQADAHDRDSAVRMFELKNDGLDASNISQANKFSATKW